MKYFLISYIEDNEELGVYEKEIIVEGHNMITCFKEFIMIYPTMYGIKMLPDPVDPALINYHSHNMQDKLRRQHLEKQRKNADVFAESYK